MYSGHTMASGGSTLKYKMFLTYKAQMVLAHAQLSAALWSP